MTWGRRKAKGDGGFWQKICHLGQSTRNYYNLFTFLGLLRVLQILKIFNEPLSLRPSLREYREHSSLKILRISIATSRYIRNYNKL